MFWPLFPQSSPARTVSWDEVLARLAQRGPEYRRAAARVDTRSILLWFDAAGLRAKAEGHRQMPGVYVDRYHGIEKVGGTSKGLILHLHAASANGITIGSDDVFQVIAFFQLVEGHLRASVLEGGSAETSYLMPYQARMWRGELHVAAASDPSNAPSWALRTYRPTTSGWKPEPGENLSTDQGNDCSTFRVGKKSISIDLVTHGYPKNLRASHAAAHLAYTERWANAGGSWKRVWRRRQDTAYNRTDELFGALAKGQSLEPFSASKDVAHRLAALRPRARGGEPHIWYAGNMYTAGRVFGVDTLGVAFHFVRRNDRWVVSRLSKLPTRNSP